MTVSYSLDIATVSSTTVFKLMTRWKGSVVKVLFKEGAVYFSIYLIINVIFRVVLNTQQKQLFEAIARYCDKYMGMIPTTFILGFYVSIVFTRWNHILNSIPWPDTAAIFTSTYLKGDAKSLLYRRTINRYIIASSVLAMRTISLQVKKRFPTMKHVVDSGLLTPTEEAMLGSLNSAVGDPKHWVLIQWAINIVARARTEGRIESDIYAHFASEKINDIRKNIGEMLMLDWVCVPLVYTQIVTLAVWTYFVASLFTRQIWIPTRPGETLSAADLELDIYVPLFTILQFICLVGWLRVAQDMLNPLGEGDDDFELNSIIDRNLMVGFLMMDDNAGIVPPLGVDTFIDTDSPALPHTIASAAAADKSSGMMPSVLDVKIPVKAQVVVESSRQGSKSPSLLSGSPTTIKRLVSRVSANRINDKEKGSLKHKQSISSKESSTSAALLLKLDEIEHQGSRLEIVDGPTNPFYREFAAKPRVGTVVEEDEEASVTPTDAADPTPLNPEHPDFALPTPVKRSDLLEIQIRKEEAGERELSGRLNVSSSESSRSGIRPK